MNNSPLAKLPPEVRNRIYSFALTHDHPLKSKIARSRLGDEPCCDEASQHTHISALSRTCKQVQNECTKLFYAANTFIIPIDNELPLDDPPLDNIRTELVKSNTTMEDHDIQILKPVLIDVGLHGEVHIAGITYRTLRLLCSLEHSHPFPLQYRLRCTFKARWWIGIHTECRWKFELAVEGVSRTLTRLSEAVAAAAAKVDRNPSFLLEDLSYASERLRVHALPLAIDDKKIGLDGVFISHEMKYQPSLERWE